MDTQYKITANDMWSTAKVLGMVAIGAAVPAVAKELGAMDFGAATPIVTVLIATGLKLFDRFVRNTK